MNSNKVTYFDSFRIEYIPKEIKRFVSDKNIIANIYRNKVKIRYWVNILLLDLLILWLKTKV